MPIFRNVLAPHSRLGGLKYNHPFRQTRSWLTPIFVDLIGVWQPIRSFITDTRYWKQSDWLIFFPLSLTLTDMLSLWLVLILWPKWVHVHTYPTRFHIKYVIFYLPTWWSEHHNISVSHGTGANVIPESIQIIPLPKSSKNLSPKKVSWKIRNPNYNSIPKTPEPNHTFKWSSTMCEGF